MQAAVGVEHNSQFDTSIKKVMPVPFDIPIPHPPDQNARITGRTEKTINPDGSAIIWTEVQDREGRVTWVQTGTEPPPKEYEKT